MICFFRVYTSQSIGRSVGRSAQRLVECRRLGLKPPLGLMGFVAMPSWMDGWTDDQAGIMRIQIPSHDSYNVFLSN